MVDKTVTVCKYCATRVTYASVYTSNMVNHLRGHNPGVSTDSTSIIKALGMFTVKYMQPNAVV